MSIVASDYDFGYDDKVLFEKTYCYSEYEAFGVPSPLTEVETTEDCETRSYVGFLSIAFNGLVSPCAFYLFLFHKQCSLPFDVHCHYYTHQAHWSSDEQLLFK